jgi:hypothetical protein
MKNYYFSIEFLFFAYSQGVYSFFSSFSLHINDAFSWHFIASYQNIFKITVDNLYTHISKKNTKITFVACENCVTLKNLKFFSSFFVRRTWKKIAVVLHIVLYAQHKKTSPTSQIFPTLFSFHFVAPGINSFFFFVRSKKNSTQMYTSILKVFYSFLGLHSRNP